MSEQRSGPLGCDVFDDHVDELALGHVEEPLRSRLLDHAATCPRCHASLEGLGAIVDRLLLAAPQVEPPAGFEGRVLERIQPPSSPALRHRRSGRWLLAVAAVALVVAAAGVLVGRDADPTTVSQSAPVVAAGGVEIGTVQLVADPTPLVLVAITNPRPGPGVRTCELRGPDGTWRQVGWWDAVDIATGVWAVGIDPDLLSATEMRITADGQTVAAATFD